MKRTFVRIIMAGVALSFLSCVSPQQKKLLSDSVPQFTGNFSPISVPFQPAFRLVQIKQSCSVSAYVQPYGRDEVFLEVGITGKCKISQLGDSLLWVWDVSEFKMGSTTLRDDVSILQMKMLSDASGRMKEFDVSSPAVESGRLVLKESKQTYKDWLEAARKEIMGYSAYTYTLPDNPVRTGDVFFKLPLTEILQSNLQSANITEPVKDLLKKWDTESPVQFILRGKTYFDGREALFVSCDSKWHYPTTPSADSFHFSISGYELIDMETCQVLFGEVLLNFSVESQQKAVKGGNYRILMTSSGKIL